MIRGDDEGEANGERMRGGRRKNERENRERGGRAQQRPEVLEEEADE